MIKQLWKKTCTCLLILGLVLTMAPVKTLKAEDPVITDPTEAERVLRETLAGVVVDNSDTDEDWRQNIEGILRNKFVVTGQMMKTNVVFLTRIKATTDAEGSMDFDVYYWLSNPSAPKGYDEYNFHYTIVIPKLLNEGDVIINNTNFPDPKFREYLGGYTIDTNDDDILSAAEIDAIEEVNVARQEISDLTGIGYLKNLKKLGCWGTKIKVLDVSGNPNLSEIQCHDNSDLASLIVKGAGALTFLKCNDTNIASIDVSENPNLETLVCQNNSSLGSLIVKGASSLKQIDCSKTGISSLDVSENHNLTELKCMESANLASLTVNGASALSYLDCGDTKIGRLDVSGNNNLVSLYCDNANLSELILGDAKNSLSVIYCDNNKDLTDLDVNGLTYLNTLECSNTGIRGLDVSNVANMDLLRFSRCNLAWLNIGENRDFDSYSTKPGNTNLSLDVTGPSFDITKEFPGIDPGKVHITGGGSLTGSDVTGYKDGEALTYEYNCGTYSDGSSAKLNVTLTLTVHKADSYIHIDNDLNRDYTGNPVNPEIRVEGSKGKVTASYFKWNGADWEPCSDIPKDVGKYAITVTVEEDDYFNQAGLEASEFVITKAANEWTTPLSLGDRTYNETAGIPAAAAKFGDVTFTYSNVQDGVYTSTAPVNAGTWYVKAIVKETENYTGLEDVKEFHISQAANEWLEAPALIGWTDGEPANTPSAKAKYGNTVFSYSNAKDGLFTDTMPENAGTWYMKAKVEATANYTGLDTVVKFTIAKKEEQKPGDKPTDNPNDKPTDNPNDKPNDKPNNKPTDKPNDKPTNKPADKTKAKSSTPVTGDTSNPALLISLLALSGGTLCVYAFRKRKSSN
ncbi:MAG: LPXTG cell wall anchor domain-containing protein [Clostridium sp.]|nr:LPXTG cell wall anchor domain-containing protein [Clostridium sp.]